MCCSESIVPGIKTEVERWVDFIGVPALELFPVPAPCVACRLLVGAVAAHNAVHVTLH